MNHSIPTIVLVTLMCLTPSAHAMIDLRPPDLERGSAFGVRVSAMIFDAAVAAPKASVDGKEAGAIFLYRTDPREEPRFVSRLESPAPSDGGAFGAGLAIGPGVVVVGEPGAATSTQKSPESVAGVGVTHVWELDNETGETEFVQTLRPPSTEIRKMGAEVAACHGYVFVGAASSKHPRAPGVVLVFRMNDSGTFRLQGRMQAPTPGHGDRFGAAIECNPRGTLVIGAPGYEGDDARGAVFIYRLSDGEWKRRQTLLAPHRGSFGNAVSLDLLDRFLAVGAYQEDRPLDAYPDYQNALGAAYLYENETPEGPADWELADRLHGPRNHSDDHFGVSVAVLGEDLYVGAFKQAETKRAGGMLHAFSRGSERWLHAAASRPRIDTPYADFGGACDAGAGWVVVGASFPVEPDYRGNAFMLSRTEAINGTQEDVQSIFGADGTTPSAPDDAETPADGARPPDADDDPPDERKPEDESRRQKERETRKKVDGVLKSTGELGGDCGSGTACWSFLLFMGLVVFAAYRRAVRYR